MAKKYIWQYPAWPNLQWDQQALAPLITQCRKKQHFLLGAASVLGFDLRLQAQGIILEKEVIETSAIEGEQLDPEGVRSSVANKLGLTTAGSRPADRKTDATVDVLLDAAKHFNTALSEERLKGWHAALFPVGYSGFHCIVTRDWRQQEMEIVSGPEGRQQVHYKAPPPEAVPEEIKSFLHWLNNQASSPSAIDGLIRAGLAHFALWPFIPLMTAMAGSPEHSRTGPWPRTKTAQSAFTVFPIGSCRTGMPIMRCWSNVLTAQEMSRPGWSGFYKAFNWRLSVHRNSSIVSWSRRASGRNLPEQN